MRLRRGPLGLTVAALVTLLLATPVAGKNTHAAATTTHTTTLTSTATATATTATTQTVTSTATTTRTSTASKATAAAAKPKAQPRKPPPPVTGSLGRGATFPQRTLVLSDPSATTLSASQVHITENGTVITPESVKPLSLADAGEFGVMLVIDESPSMSGRPLAQALAAARTLAAGRSGKQELGIVTFADLARVTLPLTSNDKQIEQALAVTPTVGQGTRILPALELALEQLRQGNIAAGGVILLSDGGDWEQGTKLTPGQIGTEAQAIGVPIYTIGLKDKYYSPDAMRALAGLGGGRFVTASGDQLEQVFTNIEAALRHRFLVRYRSSAKPGQQVAVGVSVAGVPGSVQGTYTAPYPVVHRATKPAAPRPAPARPAVIPSATGFQPLSAWPSFAPPALAPAAAPTGKSFWNKPGSLLVVAGLCGLLIGLAVLVLVRPRPGHRELQLRVENFTAVAPEEDFDTSAFVSSAPQDSSKFLERRRWWPAFVEDVDVARLTLTPTGVVKRSAVAAFAGAAVLALVTGAWWAAFPVLLISPRLMRTVVRRQARKQRRRFNDQLPAYLQDLAGAMRAGRSIAGAFAAVAESSDEPVRGEFERLVADEQLGRPLEESLETISTRMQSDDIDQVALITSLHRRSGSNVAEALDRVAEGSRDRADIRREIRALTGQARLSSWVLTALPGVLLIGITFLAPKYEKPLFHTLGGIVLTAFAALLVLGGWFVMQKIIDVEV
jgi:Flp pilus assembly protein TadB